MNILQAMKVRLAKRQAARLYENAVNALDYHTIKYGARPAGKACAERIKLREVVEIRRRAERELLMGHFSV